MATVICIFDHLGNEVYAELHILFPPLPCHLPPRPFREFINSTSIPSLVEEFKWATTEEQSEKEHFSSFFQEVWMGC